MLPQDYAEQILLIIHIYTYTFENDLSQSFAKLSSSVKA